MQLTVLEGGLVRKWSNCQQETGGTMCVNLHQEALLLVQEFHQGWLSKEVTASTETESEQPTNRPLRYRNKHNKPLYDNIILSRV